MVLSENQKLRLTSRAENIILVERMVEDVCDVYNVSQDMFGNILIALTEGVNNAIYHGNKANPNKYIEIYFKATSEQLKFAIKDEGSGFDYNNVPDPTRPEKVEEPDGRGVFLMRKLANKVSFEDNGATVILEFDLK